MHSFHGASIIERKPAAFAKSTAETAMDKVSNILRPLVSTDLDLQAYKFHRLPIVPVQLLFIKYSKQQCRRWIFIIFFYKLNC